MAGAVGRKRQCRGRGFPASPPHQPFPHCACMCVHACVHMCVCMGMHVRVHVPVCMRVCEIVQGQGQNGRLQDVRYLPGALGFVYVK